MILQVVVSEYPESQSAQVLPLDLRRKFGGWKKSLKMPTKPWWKMVMNPMVEAVTNQLKQTKVIWDIPIPWEAAKEILQQKTSQQNDLLKKTSTNTSSESFSPSKKNPPWPQIPISWLVNLPPPNVPPNK